MPILPFVEQPDQYTCQAACLAKVTGTTDVMGVRRALLQMGEPGKPSVMGAYLKPRVKSYTYSDRASLEQAAEWCTHHDRVVITHGWFTGSGHVITLISPVEKDGRKSFVVDDPWCEFNFPSWTYNYNLTGDNVVYSRHGLYAACVEGASPDHAYEIYRKGKLDSNYKNAWMHFIEN